MTGPRIYQEIRESGIAISGKDPYVMFLRHKNGAALRGIGFKFTFEEWWAIWEPHWKNRGRGSLQLCMCRTADKGDYESGNVRIATNKENQHERALEYRTTHAQRKTGYTSAHQLKVFGQAPVEWARGRNAFDEYIEENEETA